MQEVYRQRDGAMNILYLLIPVTLVFVGIAIWGFIWAVKTGQFDDLEGPAYRILMDDDDPRIPPSDKAQKQPGAFKEPEK